MATAASSRESIAALNDARLQALVLAEGEAASEREIEELVAATDPIVDSVLARYLRSRTLLTYEDAEDIRATIQLRLVLKLRTVASAPEEAIRNFRGYVATLAYNAVNDHLRKRFPERARLKTRLRYALTRDERLALWPADAGLLCGLAAWNGREDFVEDAEMPARLDPDDAPAALERIFRAAGAPVLFEDVVESLAAAWNIVDAEARALDEVAEPPDPAARIEDVDFARALWSEIRELPPMQRKALLLNLRYGGESNIISLLVLSRIARFDEIAEVLEMSRTELAALWRELPIEDAALAQRFGITRQQVINLRKSARARLSRRLGR